MSTPTVEEIRAIASKCPEVFGPVELFDLLYGLRPAYWAESDDAGWRRKVRQELLSAAWNGAGTLWQRNGRSYIATACDEDGKVAGFRMVTLGQ